VRRCSDPGHHDLRSIGVAESILHGQAIEGIGVVGDPDLVSVFQDAEIDASAAAGAVFDFDFRMPPP
jgi:hypothetical protein